MAPDNINIGHVWQAVGVIKGIVQANHTSTHERLRRIEQNTELIRHGYVEHGREIALIQQQNQMQGRSLSNLYKAVGKTEDNSIMFSAKTQGVWTALKYVGTIAIAVITIGLALYAAI